MRSALTISSCVTSGNSSSIASLSAAAVAAWSCRQIARWTSDQWVMKPAMSRGPEDILASCATAKPKANHNDAETNL